MPRFLRLILAAAVLVAAGVGGWRLLAPAPDATAQPAPAPRVTPVTTEAVRRGPVPVVVPANGIAVAEATVAVRARVDGQIEQVHVQEGQRVERRQPLFTLDARMAEALLAQQEAELARDRAMLSRAQADAARYVTLRGEGFAAQQRLEQAQADAASAAATVRAGEALIAQTRLTLDYATIEAEADGRLGALPLKAGNYVRAADGTALATITQTDPIQVQFAVPERWLPEVRAAMAEGAPPVTARAPNDAAPPVEGRLVFVDSTVDTVTGTVTLKARFDNPDDRLWPGQYLDIALVPRVEPDALTVPVAAVQTGQSGRVLYVVDEGDVARRRPVELVRVVDGRAVVRGEVAAGERVVVDGAQLLADGAPVVERRAPPPAAAAAPQTPRG